MEHFISCSISIHDWHEELPKPGVFSPVSLHRLRMESQLCVALAGPMQVPRQVPGFEKQHVIYLQEGG